MEAVKGSQLVGIPDHCGYPLSGLPREPPGVRAPLQLHHRCLGQQSPVHSCAVVGDPWRPDSHPPTPAPPPFLNGEAIRVWCPLGPLVYAGCSAAASAASTGGTQGREALSAPWCPSTCPGYALGRGEPDPARVAAPPVPKAVKECGSDRSCATYHRLPVPTGSRGVVGWLVLVTWRLRAQAHISPGGLSVRLSSLPAGAWSTRHTLPRAMCANVEQQWSKQVCHSPSPPPPLQTHQGTYTQAQRHPRAPPRGLGAVNSPVGLVTGHPGTAAQSGTAGKAALTLGRRPGEAFTQPNPTPPCPQC